MKRCGHLGGKKVVQRDEYLQRMPGGPPYAAPPAVGLRPDRAH